jgi:hypothetical protein
MVFVSHANPEDNLFTRWLALRLAREGYPVWCDLTRLLGGEDFWRDIEAAIRDRTAKFLFVLSKTSNQKQGTLMELAVARKAGKSIHDFVIPLRIDDIRHDDINIELQRLNCIEFSKGWAGGYKVLLEKLEKDGVAKDQRFGPKSVADWWRHQFGAERGVLTSPEEYFSNWFRIKQLPDRIYFHCVPKRKEDGPDLTKEWLAYPGFFDDRFLISFAKADNFVGLIKTLIQKDKSHSFKTDEFLAGKVNEHVVSRRQTHNHVVQLLKIAWETMVEKRALPLYELSQKAKCFYFPTGAVESDNISFVGVKGRTFRGVVGYKTLKPKDDGIERKRYWHFAIQARASLAPDLGYVIKPHVLFSDDGKRIWQDDKKLHRARRSQCKNWWNPDWRDRILASVSWLANGKPQFQIPVNSKFSLEVESTPVRFNSPVSYQVAEDADSFQDDETEETDDEGEEDMAKEIE